MGASIGSLAVVLSANVERFERAMESTQKSVSRMSDSVSKVSAPAIAIWTKAIDLATDSVIRFGRSILNQRNKLDELAKTADRLEILPAQLEALSQAAITSGTSINSLERGIQRLQRELVKAQISGGRTSQIIQAIGLDLNELVKLNPAEQFEKVANAISTLTEAERTFAIRELFGRAGTDLLNLVTGMSDAMAAADPIINRFASVFNRRALAGVEKMNDSVFRLTRVWQLFISDLTIKVAPAIDAILERVLNFVLNSETLEMIWTKIGNLIIDAGAGIEFVLRNFERGLGRIQLELGTMLQNLGKVSNVMGRPMFPGARRAGSSLQSSGLERMAGSSDFVSFGEIRNELRQLLDDTSSVADDTNETNNLVSRLRALMENVNSDVSKIQDDVNSMRESANTQATSLHALERNSRRVVGLPGARTIVPQFMP